MPAPATSRRHPAARRLAATLLAWALAPTLALSQQEASERLDSAAAPADAPPWVAPADLVVWNRRVATFRAPFGALSPTERARGAQRRIEDLPLDLLDDDAELHETTSGGHHGLLVVVGNTTLFGLLDDDVDASSGETLAGAADRARRELRDVFAARIEQRRPATIVRAIGVAIATAIVVAAICFADIRIRRRIASRLDLLVRRSGEPSLGLPGRPLLSSTARIVLDAAVWTIRILVAYVALAIVLRQLPYTRPLSERLGDFLLALLGGLGARLVSALPGLLVAIIIFTVTRLVARSLDRAFDRVEEGRLSVSWLHATTVPATRRIVRVVLWLFALSVAYPYLPGSDTAAFKGISVFVGAMLTLGSTALVAQLMSGLVIIYSQALKPGDLVQIGETMGFVTDVGMLSTKLRTTRGEQITIPNALVIGNKVTNFVEDALIAAKVSIGYNVAWRQVHEMLLMAAQRTPGLRAQPAPYVVQRALSDFSAEYELRAQPERFDERLKTLYALHAHIQDVFHELGVQIMVPHFEMQPDQPVVPPHADSREQIDTEGDATTRATGGGS